MTHPKKSKSLHVETLNDELSVYDWQHQQMHSLNPTAASVFELCDGETSPEQMAVKLDAPKELIWQSLAELDKAQLLEVDAEKTAFWQKDISRRQFVKVGAGVAAAAIVSIMLPSPAAAQSAVVPTAVPTAAAGYLERTTVATDIVATSTRSFYAFPSPFTVVELAAHTFTSIELHWTSGLSPASSSSLVDGWCYLARDVSNYASGYIEVDSTNSTPVVTTPSNRLTGNHPYNGITIQRHSTAASDWTVNQVTIRLYYS